MSKQFDPKRIEILRDILLRLHNGASPESVQDEFNKHFTHVSAIEISLMEHELMNGDHGITFEDVMKLCNVHANLFKGAVDAEHVPKTKHPGHPMQVFKDENRALQAVLIRINRIFSSLERDPTLLEEEGVIKGLRNQISLLGQFHNHYNRKEKLFFPIMERYGHYAPPKVMWGVDDEIRGLFKEVKQKVDELPHIDLAEVKTAFQAFELEFKEMIFKEESILLPMVLSIFNEDDWLAIANESDAFGYAIIQPEEKWIPQRKSFDSVNEAESEANKQNKISESPKTEFEHLLQEVKRLNEKVEALAKQTPEIQPEKESEHIPFGGGYLTTKEANLILNNLPLEITFVDKNDIFKYFNQKVAEEEMMLVRTPSAIGRNVANCHPPKSLKKVMTLVRDLKSGKRTSESMWFKKKDQYIYITYKGVFDENGEYLGILEYVQDIQPFFELPSEVKTDLSELEGSAE